MEENKMNKKLFTQIKNEWRSNTWLALELLIVSVLMWYIIDNLYVTTTKQLQPKGFDIEHCYLIQMGILSDKSPDYKPYTNNKQNREEVKEIMERLRRRPEIEAVSLSQNAYPYNGSNGSIQVELANDTLRQSGYTYRRLATPDFVRVFRYQGANGETPEQLAKMLERDEILVSDNLFNKYGKKMTDYVGQRFHLQGDTTYSYRLGASIVPIRYDDFQEQWNSYSMVWLLPEYMINSYRELCVRVKADQDVDFIERLKADSESQFRIGNVYISNIRSFEDIRRNFQQYQSNELRNLYTGMAFLLVNIFLGLLGTFWVRTQQRKSEIALHKAHGATNQMVFTRLLSEGWLLLLIVTPIVLLIDFNLAHAELNSWRNGTTLEWDRLLFCGGISFALIALMIAIGIGIPARKAMKIDPAEALHNE